MTRVPRGATLWGMKPPLDRRVNDRRDDSAARRKLQVLLVLAVLATAAGFWLIHASGVLRP